MFRPHHRQSVHCRHRRRLLYPLYLPLLHHRCLANLVIHRPYHQPPRQRKYRLHLVYQGFRLLHHHSSLHLHHQRQGQSHHHRRHRHRHRCQLGSDRWNFSARRSVHHRCRPPHPFLHLQHRLMHHQPQLHQIRRRQLLLCLRQLPHRRPGYPEIRQQLLRCPLGQNRRRHHQHLRQLIHLHLHPRQRPMP